MFQPWVGLTGPRLDADSGVHSRSCTSPLRPMGLSGVDGIVQGANMRQVLTFLLFLVTMPAYADSGSAADATLAEALFDEGQELMVAGNYQAACEKFQESQRNDPGGGTLLNLGDCYKKLGRTASAWSTFKAALTTARKDGRQDRVEHLESAILELEGRLTKLEVVVPEEANVPGLVVEVDGQALRPAAWGVAVPVDPGEHEVRVLAPDAETFVVTIDCSDEGETQSVTIPRARRQVEGADEEATTPRDRSPQGQKQRRWGYAIGGVGVVATAVGGVFGVLAIAQWNERNKNCSPGCNGDAVTAGGKSETSAMVANVGLGVGLVAIAGGVTLILTAPRDAPVAQIQLAPQVASDSAGLRAGVTW